MKQKCKVRRGASNTANETKAHTAELAMVVAARDAKCRRRLGVSAAENGGARRNGTGGCMGACAVSRRRAVARAKGVRRSHNGASEASATTPTYASAPPPTYVSTCKAGRIANAATYNAAAVVQRRLSTPPSRAQKKEPPPPHALAHMSAVSRSARPNATWRPKKYNHASSRTRRNCV